MISFIAESLYKRNRAFIYIYNWQAVFVSIFMIYFPSSLIPVLCHNSVIFYEQSGNIMRNITGAVCIFCPLAERVACHIFCFQPKLTILTSYVMGKDVFTVWPLYAGILGLCAINFTWAGVPVPFPTPFRAASLLLQHLGERDPDVYPLFFIFRKFFTKEK